MESIPVHGECGGTRMSLFPWIFVVVSRVRSIFRVTTTNQEVACSSRAGGTKSLRDMRLRESASRQPVRKDLLSHASSDQPL